MSERTHGGAPRSRREENSGDTRPPEGSFADIGPRKTLKKTADIAVATAISTVVKSVI